MAPAADQGQHGEVADIWQQGSAYERFMGRWSRLLAPQFVQWLDQPTGRRWADLGCGTGALTGAILEHADPASVLAVEPSAGFLELARSSVRDPRVTFREGSIEQLGESSVDVVVAGLVLNFLPDPAAAVAACRAAVESGVASGVVAAYVWDYDDGMQLLRRFWEVATRVAGRSLGQSEVSGFEVTDPDRLAQLWRGAGLHAVEVGALEIEMVFEDFDDYWSPFLGGQGPAPAYVAGLGEHERGLLRDALRTDLSPGADGRIRLPARAWAARGDGRTTGPQ